MSAAPADPQFSAVHDNGNGTYTTTLTSSHNAETTQIFAFDASGTSAVYLATLTQLGPSATSVVGVTNQPVSAANPPATNQGVVLVATVTSLAVNLVAPNGTVTFQNAGTPIAGCQSVPIPPQSGPSVSVTCSTSFSAVASPASVSAVFTPADGSLVAGSASPADSFPIVRDSTSTAVGTAAVPAVGAPVTYVARITPSSGGTVVPTGFVRFADSGRTIRSCGRQPVNASGSASCTTRYHTTGAHVITAAYGGDAAFTGSTSAPVPVSVQPLGTITAALQWRFFYTAGYTRVLQLTVSRVPSGSTLSVTCHGRGCRFRRRRSAVRAGNHCGATKHHKCATLQTVDLAAWIAKSLLRPGARVKIAITKLGWIGKGYIFTVHAGRAPTVQIGCTAAGSHTITARC